MVTDTRAGGGNQRLMLTEWTKEAKISLAHSHHNAPFRDSVSTLRGLTQAHGTDLRARVFRACRALFMPNPSARARGVAIGGGMGTACPGAGRARPGDAVPLSRNCVRKRKRRPSRGRLHNGSRTWCGTT